MPAEYKTVTTADPADAELNVEAVDGWTVKQAYSPTSFLLERQAPPIPPLPLRAVPTPPTGPRR